MDSLDMIIEAVYLLAWGDHNTVLKTNFRKIPLGSLDCYHFHRDKMRMHMNQNDPISASCSNNERYEGKRQLFPQ